MPAPATVANDIPVNEMNPHQKQALTDVTIAVVSHGHCDYLEPCFSSMVTNTHKVSYDVTLVDNIGEDCVRELVESKYPQFKLVVNEQPLGFSKNNNLILADVDSRYVFLLNPDTVLFDGALDELIEYMDAHPEVGACAPKLLYPDGSLQLSCRQFPSLRTLISRRTPLRRWLGDGRAVRNYTMADWDHNTPRRIDWAFGAAILARREVWNVVGPLDEGMFMYCEDIDWCMRCQLAGWEMHYVPDAVLTHHLDDEKYNEYLSKSRRQHYKTMFQFFLKYPRCCIRW